MIRQIVLALLALFLTLPAAAAPLCHAPTAQPATVDHTTMDHAAMGHASPASPEDDRQSPPAMSKQHGCLGCAAPVSAAPEVVAKPLPPHSAPTRRIAALTGIAMAPALPPPRS